MLTFTYITNCPSNVFFQVSLEPYATGSPATETAHQMKVLRSKAKTLKKRPTNVLGPRTAMVATQRQYNSFDWSCIGGQFNSLAFSTSKNNSVYQKLPLKIKMLKTDERPGSSRTLELQVGQLQED